MAECFIPTILSDIEGLKVPATGNLYKWKYGQYRVKDMAISQTLIPYTERRTLAEYNPSYYDVTLNADGSITRTYKGYLTGGYNVGSAANGYYYWTTINGKSAYARITGVGYDGNYYLIDLNGYYPFDAHGWLSVDGYIFSKLSTTYPNGAYLNEIYYGELYTIL